MGAMPEQGIRTGDRGVANRGINDRGIENRAGSPRRAQLRVAQAPPVDTQVLYIHPPPPKPQVQNNVEHKWSFDTAEGRREYEAALGKHLKDKKIISGNTTYEPLYSSSDIAKLASNKVANLVLIVHSAGDGPAIAVNLANSAAGTKADWIRDEKFADVIAPFGYKTITVLGCDAVSNNFTPNLAKRLPAGSLVIGHKGHDFEISRHFELDKKVPGRLRLTQLKSNLSLQTFRTEGKSP
jgi:hypothetical protein